VSAAWVQVYVVALFLDAFPVLIARAGSFGIGTWLTNDFKKKSSGYEEQSKALNIVIKLGSIDGKECVKISDEIMKVGYVVNLHFVVSLMALCVFLIQNTGVPEVVAKVKEMYQIPVS
jgi:nicotinate phosphoribosyltransferase